MTNAIPDIPRLYTAVAECLCAVIIIMISGRNVVKKKTFVCTAVYFGLLVAFLELTANIVIWMWIPCMIAAFLLMCAYVYLCANVSFKKSVYYGMLAFSAAELIASLEWQIVNYAYSDPASMPWYVEILILVSVFGATGFLLYRIFSPRMKILSAINLRSEEWLTAMFITVIVFLFSNLRFITDDFIAGQYSREIASARTLIDLAGVAFLYAHCLSICNNQVVRELDAVHQTLETQYQQYKQSRESIDIINMRYHDLKHEIQYLKAEQDAEKRNEFLNKLENDIKSFEVQNKTGNAVLDTILTSKSLYCYKHGITMTSVADGKLLDFINVIDICSIFGNALDNAIESVLRIEDKEKRLIHLTVSQHNEFVMIRIENYYEGEILMNGSEYVSTKDDKKLHGYGIKSIKYTIDKYGGAVNINTEDNWFDVKMIIPLGKKIEEEESGI